MANKHTALRALFPGPLTTQGASSTTEVEAKDKNGTIITLKVPARLFTNRTVVIRASGDVTLGAGTFSILINKGTALAGTLLASSGALTPAASGTFLLEFKATVEAGTDVLQGTVTGHVGGTVVTYAVGANAAWDPAIENTLFVSFDWGTSNASNRTALRNLEVDIL